MRNALILVALSASLTACGDAERPGADPRYGQLEQAATVCASGPTVEGIDVSQWQGAIDWNAVRASGKEFAIARIGDGLGHDPTFQDHWAAIKSVGMIRGAYQFFRTSRDALAQADIVVAAVGRLGPGDLPVTCDVEDPSSTVSPATYEQMIHSWADRVEQGTGKRPMIYTGRYYWDPKVASGDFAGYPLWHAQYTNAACPNISDHWGSWTFWQYRAEPYPSSGIPGGTCPGISGWVDLDHFNGTLDDLRRFAGANQSPAGWLDAAGCAAIAGWAFDPDEPGRAIDVHLYVDGPAGDPKATGFSVNAGTDRTDLCGVVGSCNHAYALPTPLAFQDGKPHVVHAYGIDAGGGANAELQGSPRTLACPLPERPFTPRDGVKRHVPSPETLAAWKLSWTDLVVLADAELATYPEGPAVGPAPSLVRADGDAAVYVRDGKTLRHVPTPGVMASWRFEWSQVEVVQAAALSGTVKGVAWPARPFLVRGSGPAVYALDRAPALWGVPKSDDLPATLAQKASQRVTFTVENRGSIAWQPGEVFLATVGPRGRDSALCDPSWPSCARAATVTAATAPGAVGTFTFQALAPANVGKVHECFGLVFGSAVWFGEAGQLGPGDEALCSDVEIVPLALVPATPEVGRPPPARTDPTEPAQRDGGGPTWTVTAGFGCSAAARGALGFEPLGALVVVLAAIRRRVAPITGPPPLPCPRPRRPGSRAGSRRWWP